MALEILVHEIEKHLADIQSDKVTVRSKALDSLQLIFDNRSKEVIKALAGNQDVSWRGIFMHLHDATKAQAIRLDDSRCTAATKNRTGDYSTILMKCINLANSQMQNIAYDVIFETAFQAFGDASSRKHFDLCYVQIIHKHILHSRRNLATVEIHQWSRLLSYFFELFERSGMPKLNLLECVPLLVRCGTRNSHLATDLHQYLPNVERIVRQDHQIKAQHQVMMIVYEFMINLAANHRISICKFTEEVLSELIKQYNYRMDDATKLVLFKILHLSIVVHYPRAHTDETHTFSPDSARSLPPINYVNDIHVWHKQLRSMHHIVESEIKECGKSFGRSQIIPNFCNTFDSMAAALCAVIFWNDDVWVLPSDEQTTKKFRGISKLERLNELIERGDYAWQWAKILSKLMIEYTNLIQIEDFQPLLQMLSDLQPKVKYSVQGKVFNDLVRVMVIAESDLKAKGTGILESFCTEHWHRIMQMALKNCATSNETAEQNVHLLQIMIENGYIVSYAFIETIAKEISSNTMKKSTATIRLLIAIFQHVNMDLLTSGDEIKAAVINWLSPKIAASELKRVIGNEENIDIALIAELYVLCVLSKTDKLSKLSFEYTEPTSTYENTFDAIIDNLKQQFSYQYFDRLMAVNCSQEIERQSKHQNSPVLPEAKTIDVVLSEKLYSELEKSLNPDDNFQSSTNTLDDFAIIASSLTTYINILNQFFACNAFDYVRYEKSFLYKRIAIKIGQLNTVLEGLVNCEEKDKFDVVEKLGEIWKFGLHPLLEQLIFERDCNSKLVEWLAQQSQSQLRPALQPLNRISFADLPFAWKMQLKCLVLLARFSTMDDDNGKRAFQVLDNLEIDTQCNENLFVMFELVRIILNRRSPEMTVQWAFEFLQTVCVELKDQHQFMEQVIENIPALAKSTRTLDSMQHDQIVLLSAFILQCHKKRLNPHLTVRLISKLKYAARDFPLDETFFDVFSRLKFFLKSDDIRIQFEAVTSLTYIFNHRWINDEVAVGDGPIYMDILQKLYGAVRASFLPTLPTENSDKKSCDLAVRAQLHCSIVASCFCLRKENWFRLFELCCFSMQIRRDLILKMVTQICEKSLNTTHVDALKKTVPYLIAKWIEHDYDINLFPWYFTSSKSHNDFLLDENECIAIAVLRHAPNLISEYVQMMQAESLESILRRHETIVINCLAFITPLSVIDPSDSLNDEYKASAKKLATILMKSLPHCEQYFITHSMEIVEHLLENTWDEAHYESLFGTRVTYIAENHAINHRMFSNSLTHIQNKYGNRTNIFQHYFAAEPHRLLKLLYTLKLQLQEAPFLEEKMFLLYHFCISAEPISDILRNVENRRQNHTVEFFVRDLLHFFGNLINTSDKWPELKFAACKYFMRFCKHILPAVAKYFKPYLNFVVSVLVPIIKKNEDKPLAACSMELLKFLIDDHVNELRDSIAILDRFPSQNIFNALRQVQDNIKYGGKEFSLIDEIEYFLSVEKRKIEGLIALKEHLSNKKNELQKIFQRIYDASEDCEKSIMHRLINSLLQIVQSVDTEKAMMAAKCLGELGPSDLGTTVLKTDIDSKIYRMCADFDEATTALYTVSLDMLNSLLLHTDARVLQAVANACAHLLQTDIGRSNAEEKSHMDVFKINGPVKSLITHPNDAIDLLQLVESDEKFTHTVWIKKLTILLLQHFGDEHLSAVASLQALFADAVLPLLIKILLSIKSTQYDAELGSTVRTFFEKHFNSYETNLSTDNDLIYCNKMAIKSMLNVAECIRVHNLNVRGQKIALNYLHIAKAAHFCDAHFTAILYGEMARMKRTSIAELEYDDNKVKMVMKDSYQSIGEIDSVSAFIDPIKCRSEYLRLKKSWNELYLRLDATSMMQSTDTSAYAQHMSDSGLYSFANVLMQKANEINYECAWRLGDWSVIERMSDSGPQKNNGADECEKYHYLALKCLNGKDESGVKVNVERARIQIIQRIKLSSYECTRNIYKDLTSLQLLQQIEEFCDVQFNVSDTCAEMVINKWKGQDAIGPSDFIHREPVLAQRVRLFEAAGVRAKRKIQSVCKSEESIPAMVLQLAGECREEGHFTFATRHLATINAERLSREMAAKYHIEDARLNWALGNQPLAKQLIECVTDKKFVSFSYLTSQRILGEYLAETRSEETKVVISDYLANSIKSLQNMKSNMNKLKDITTEDFNIFYAKHKLETYQLIAKYADREYQQIAEYKKSVAYEKKKSNVSNNKKRLGEMKQRCRSGQDISKEENSARFILEGTIKIDEKDLKATEMDYDHYLEYAMESYLRCITLEANEINSNRSNMFRVFSLWLANNTNACANDTLEKYITKVPSYKFVPLMPQITTHLSPNDDDFSKLIERIVERCAVDHPHHTLYQIFALAHATHGIETSNVVKPARTIAAEALIQKLENKRNVCQIIVQMRRMCDTLIKLAHKKMKPEMKTLPKDEPICKLKDLNLIQCPTVKLAISTDALYPNERLTTIVKWNSDVWSPGGINAPKQIKCICSNGRMHLQLVKEGDDLRQDAVMQQVFHMMNNMLSYSKTTKKIRLKIRTYIVVPLSQRTGILEWCENTIALTEYLVGTGRNKGAHERYFPQDDKPSQCRVKLASIADRKKKCELTVDQAVVEFNQICAKINPVLQYFFYEKFYSPGVWFERRLAYAHSLATTSMIGYILGIGDRHVSNILIDEKTAELIHIDFGIAFEQGKCLPTPETIPFRLTRDLVAALGSTGIEGVFRKSCEKTLEVLRTNKITIVTIIEVLIHDPLYSWALTSQKVQKRQHHRDNAVDEIQDINGMAERALLRLEEKLDGKHLSRSEAKSVEAHVDILIQEATNMRNLSQLFAGWQAYL